MAPCLLVTESSPLLGGAQKERTLSPVRPVLKAAYFLLLYCIGVFLCIWGVSTRLDYLSKHAQITNLTSGHHIRVYFFPQHWLLCHCVIWVFIMHECEFELPWLLNIEYKTRSQTLIV